MYPEIGISILINVMQWLYPDIRISILMYVMQ